MNKRELIAFLEGIDAHLSGPAVLCVYGAAAFILLDEVERTSVDIDVAGPYSDADYSDLRKAAEKAGLKVNPDEDQSGDHIEWISEVRLCLPRPDKATQMELWRGKNLILRTVSPPQLIASKLIRYDEVDQSDIRYLCFQMKIRFPDIAAAVESLPRHFREDPVLRENLENLRSDLQLWEGERS